MNPIIEVDNLSKVYQLGSTGLTSVRELFDRWGGGFRRKAAPAAAGPGARGAASARRGGDGQTFWALDEVSFQVHRGEVVGIIGRNGAGKSTLLKILSRITEPTRGRAVLRGRVASLLEVGTGFHPELTGRENIYLNGAILGMKRPEIARKFDEIVEFAEVSAFIDTPVKRYSSGMYVRLAFAVAAHLEPEILIVDEVLAVGDIDFQRKCIDRMGKVAGEGRTVLLVSHNVGLIETLCDSAVLLVDGRLAARGSAGEVVGEYLARGASADRTDLLSIPRQGGSGSARFARIEVIDERGKAGSEVRMGESLTVQMTVKAERRVQRPWVGVKLRTALNQELFHCANREAGQELAPLEGECVVECRLESLNLLPGRYIIDLLLADMSNTVHDEVSSATHFDVIARDVFESGMPMGSQYGVVYFKSSWTVRSLIAA